MTDPDLEITAGCIAVHPDDRGGQVARKRTGATRSALTADERTKLFTTRWARTLERLGEGE